VQYQATNYCFEKDSLRRGGCSKRARQLAPLSRKAEERKRGKVLARLDLNRSNSSLLFVGFTSLLFLFVAPHASWCSAVTHHQGCSNALPHTPCPQHDFTRSTFSHDFLPPDERTTPTHTQLVPKHSIAIPMTALERSTSWNSTKGTCIALPCSCLACSPPIFARRRSIAT